ncbi:MAG: outer membrane beta-barrel protein [Nitrospirales bacterium]
MKIAALVVSASSLFLLLAIPGVATAGERQEFTEEARFYIALFAGVTRPEDLQNVTGRPEGAPLPDRKLDNGGISNGIYGVKVGFIPEKEYTWFGVEGEYFVTDSEVSADPGGNGPANMSVSALSMNFLLRDADGWIQPYIGVGPSLMWASSHQFQGADGGDSITAPGLNLLAGLRIPIFNRMMLFGEYKHTRATLDFKSIRVDYRLHALVAGVGVMF